MTRQVKTIDAKTRQHKTHIWFGGNYAGEEISRGDAQEAKRLLKF